MADVNIELAEGRYDKSYIPDEKTDKLNMLNMTKSVFKGIFDFQNSIIKNNGILETRVLFYTTKDFYSLTIDGCVTHHKATILEGTELYYNFTKNDDNYVKIYRNNTGIKGILNDLVQFGRHVPVIIRDLPKCENDVFIVEELNLIFFYNYEQMENLLTTCGYDYKKIFRNYHVKCMWGDNRTFYTVVVHSDRPFYFIHNGRIFKANTSSNSERIIKKRNLLKHGYDVDSYERRGVILITYGIVKTDVYRTKDQADMKTPPLKEIETADTWININNGEKYQMPLVSSVSNMWLFTSYESAKSFIRKYEGKFSTFMTKFVDHNVRVKVDKIIKENDNKWRAKWKEIILSITGMLSKTIIATVASTIVAKVFGFGQIPMIGTIINKIIDIFKLITGRSSPTVDVSV